MLGGECYQGWREVVSQVLCFDNILIIFTEFFTETKQYWMNLPADSLL